MLRPLEPQALAIRRSFRASWFDHHLVLGLDWVIRWDIPRARGYATLIAWRREVPYLPFSFLSLYHTHSFIPSLPLSWEREDV